MGHGHDHGSALTGRRLLLSIIITLAFVLGEASTGYFSHSLALMSDAGHNFADALALVFSWYGIWIARKPSTHSAHSAISGSGSSPLWSTPSR